MSKHNITRNLFILLNYLERRLSVWYVYIQTSISKSYIKDLNFVIIICLQISNLLASVYISFLGRNDLFAR